MRHHLRWAGILAGAGILVAGAAPASAQLTDVGIFKNLTHEQTDGTTVTATGGFFNAIGDFTSAGDFGAATLSYPGPGSPENLPLTSPTNFGIGPGFPTQAAMDAAYPFGTYSFSFTGGTMGPASESVNYTADAYTADVPKLEAASFNALLGLSTSLSSLTLNFNAFTPSPLATSAFTFFTIFGSSQNCGFLAPSATSCAIDPRALTPGTTYDWELDFSDRVENFVGGVDLFTNFDVRTDGMFTTASIPESSTWTMALLGFAGLGFVARRRISSRAFV
jgi:hypothetical protein